MYQTLEYNSGLNWRTMLGVHAILCVHVECYCVCLSVHAIWCASLGVFKPWSVQALESWCACLSVQWCTWVLSTEFNLMICPHTFTSAREFCDQT